MLDEHALRQPEWKPGNPVKLADGQTWHIRKPRLRLHPVFVGQDAAIQTSLFGPELDPLVEIISGVAEVDAHIWISARFTIVAKLLRENYELADADLFDLLVIDSEDEANREMWKVLTGIARGEGPKPMASTSEPAA